MDDTIRNLHAGGASTPSYSRLYGVITLGAVCLAFIAEAFLVVRVPDNERAFLLYVSAVVLSIGVGLAQSSPAVGLRMPVARSGHAVLPQPVLIAFSLATLGYALLVISEDRTSVVGVILWLASIALFLAAVVEGNWKRPWAGERSFSKRALLEVGAVTLIVLVALGLRVWMLGEFPSGIHGDEGETGLEALRILDGQTLSPFVTGWMGHPTLYFFLLAGWMKVFGTGLEGLRSFAGVSGALTIPLLYLFVRQLFERRTAIIAATLLAISATHLQFSRIGLNNVQTPLLWVASFYFFWRGLHHGRLIDWGLAGLLAGFSMYFYYASRVVPVILAIFLLYLIVVQKGFLQRFYLHIALLALGGLLVCAPLGLFFIERPQEWTARAVENSVFQNRPRLEERYQTANTVDLAWQQIKQTALIFYNRGDASSFYETGQPAINPWVAALFTLGLAYATVRWRDPRFFFCSLWFWLNFLMGGVLSIDTPYLPRLVGLLPVVFVFAALAANRAIEALSTLHSRLTNLASAAGIAVLVLAAGWGDLALYFRDYAQTYPWSVATTQAKYVASLRDGYQVWVAGAPVMYFGHGSTRFLAYRGEGGDLKNPYVDLPIRSPGGKGLAFLVYPMNGQFLPTIKEYYPVGKEQPVSSGDGTLMFTAYLVSSDEAQQVASSRPPSIQTQVSKTPAAGHATYPETAPQQLGVLTIIGRGTSGDGALRQPVDLVTDSKGNIYVADVGLGCVLKYDLAGRWQLTWCAAGSHGNFVEPSSIVADDQDMVFVLDSETMLVSAFDAEGHFRYAWRSQSPLFHPRGLAIDSSNNLYVVDTGFDRVLEFIPAGEQLAEYGPQTGVSLRQPTDVVVDHDGHLFVADTGSMRLIVLDRSGRLLHEWPLPRADTRRGVHLALAPDGSLWLTDPQDSSLLHQDSSGRSLAKLGPQGRSGQFLWQPVGIHVDHQGNLYIADAQAGQVVRIAAGQIP